MSNTSRTGAAAPVRSSGRGQALGDEPAAADAALDGPGACSVLEGSRPDRLVFGLEGAVLGSCPDDVVAALAAAGWVNGERPARADGALIRLRFLFGSDEVPGDAGVGEVRADLQLRATPHGCSISTRSSLTINPLSLARSALAGVSAGPLGFNRATNVLDPGHGDAAAELLEQLFELVESAVDISLNYLTVACAPGQLRLSSTWLKACEACLDVALPHAIADVRRAQRAALTGAVQLSADSYRWGAVDEAGIPAVTFKTTQNGPALKVYAKRGDVCRLEVAARDRKAVERLTGRSRATPNGAGARALAAAALAAAAPELGLLQSYLEEVVQGSISPAELIAELD